MARKALLDTYYQFTPATRTIVIPRAIKQERLVLITDVATNTVIYNFSDPSLKATSYTVGVDSTGANTTTTIVLNYNTTALSTTDKLQIIIDEYDEKITPAETMMDPVNKLRVSTPQTLIDTDYEYSTQYTKWEGLGLINNRPYAYFSTVTNNLNLTDIQAVQNSRIYTANVYPLTPPVVGSAVTILDTQYAGADGTYIVDSNASPSAYNFSYTGKFVYSGTSGSIFNSTTTQGYQSYPYSNAAIATGSTGSLNNITSITANALIGTGTVANVISVYTTTPHGLSLGNEIGVTGIAYTGGNPNGSYVVCSVANAQAFSYQANITTSATISAFTTANLYCRPMGLTVHRPTQAGIRFSVNEQSHNAQYIRQTRRYFRYQSGKGIQMSTGTTLNPNMFFDSVTASGTTITVTTKDPHNIWNPNVTVVIAGCNEANYNGTYNSVTVITPYQFQVTAAQAPSVATASGSYYGAVTNWYTGGTRIGLFDANNGVFFEYDGQTLWAVRRSATFNLSGTISVTPGSNTVTGVAGSNGATTAFSKQLQPNDFITIKGMTYRVINIASDTSMTINPAYRGQSASSVSLYTKVVDTRIPQSAWNIDRCDGTGPSGFQLNLAKNQMMYIDYSWYGAGHIRFGFRGADGNVIYCHKILNNNVNNIAYMRSGNLPARYETHSFSKSAILTGGASGVGTNLLTTDTTMYVSDAYQWPTTGTVVLRNATQQEFVNFSAVGQANQSTYTYSSGGYTLTLVGGNTTGIAVGQYVNGAGIPPLTTVQSVSSGVSVTLNNPVYLSTNANGNPINFAPYLTVAANGRAQTGGTYYGLTVTNGSNVITGFANTNGIQPGQFVSGPGIPNQSLVVSVSANSVTLNIAAFQTTSTTAAVTFIPANGWNSTSTGAQQFNYSATALVAVELHAPTYSSEINHWGTSAIMDGGFTLDKQYIFTKGMTTFANIYPGQSNAIMSFRIAPSASQGIPGNGPGLRDQINHMQMIPYEMDAYSNGSFLMSVVVNGTPIASALAQDNKSIPNWTNVGGSSLSQYIFYNGNTTMTGGETIFGFYMNTTGSVTPSGPGFGTTYNTTQQDFTQVKDLGTSVLGGGQIGGNVGIYPDGPETITIVATNLSTGTTTQGLGNLVARFSWNEAQA
jgi:hypothetical protein